MTLVSSGAMFSEIASEADIDRYDVWEGYDPQDLHKAAKAYDNLLDGYLNEYKKAGLQVRHYSEIGRAHV